MTHGDSVLHTYGVVESPPEALPRGVDGTETTVVDVGGLQVLVGRLDASRFGADVWARNGQDPRWLEPVARQHHEVLQALCELDGDVTVVPLRLPGIYPDEAAVAGALAAQVDDLTDALDLVRGHAEWGVKVFLVGSGSQEQEPAPSSGRDYLMRRSAAAKERDQLREQRQRLVLDVHEGLATVATRSAVNAPQDAALSGRKEPMLLNSAHLVAHPVQQQFFALAEELDRQLEPQGLRLEVSGPWPPYNFAQVDGRERSGTA